MWARGHLPSHQGTLRARASHSHAGEPFTPALGPQVLEPGHSFVEANSLPALTSAFEALRDQLEFEARVVTAAAPLEPRDPT